MAKTSSAAWMIGLGGGGLVGVVLGLLVSTSCRAEENVMRVDTSPAWHSSRMVALAEKYEGMTARQIGLPARLWCADFINHLRKEAGLPKVGSRRAADQVLGGKRLSSPQVGALVITWRGIRAAHVDLIKEVRPDGTLITIGGNVSRRVMVRERVVARAVYVMPE